MPFISDAAIEKVATKLQGFEAREEKRKVEVRSKTKELLLVGEGAIGAAAVGFLHGRYEDADANFFVPRTSLPLDFLIGVGGVGLAFFGAFGQANEHALNVSNGVLNGATAMYFRKHAQAGKRSDKFWAGEPDLLAPITHNHPAIGVGAAMSDTELAAALRKAL
ncbi:MAG TPA: hypothetical protein VJV79_02380 [Polyangiaceae bacterium]|nr:hypothetical protein [Polyangiaceae bacterium]